MFETESLDELIMLELPSDSMENAYCGKTNIATKKIKISSVNVILLYMGNSINKELRHIVR